MHNTTRDANYSVRCVHHRLQIFFIEVSTRRWLVRKDDGNDNDDDYDDDGDDNDSCIVLGPRSNWRYRPNRSTIYVLSINVDQSVLTSIEATRIIHVEG